MNSKLILVVDDEAEILAEVSGYLSQKGYQVITAKNGRDAINLFKMHGPILVLSDYKMPVMNGLELLKAVKMLKKEIHVVLISGAADAKAIVEAMKENAFDFLSKPVDLNELLSIVKTAIEKTMLIIKKKSAGKEEVNLTHEISEDMDNVSIVYFNDALDEYSVEKFTRSINLFLHDGILKHNIIFFLKNVYYINNIGLNFLLETQEILKHYDHELFLCNVSDKVESYLKTLGYLNMFFIEKTFMGIYANINKNG